MFKSICISIGIIAALAGSANANITEYTEDQVYSAVQRATSPAEHEVVGMVCSFCPVNYKALANIQKRGVAVGILHAASSAKENDYQLATDAGLKINSSFTVSPGKKPNAFLIIDHKMMITFEATDATHWHFFETWDKGLVDSSYADLKAADPMLIAKVKRAELKN